MKRKLTMKHIRSIVIVAELVIAVVPAGLFKAMQVAAGLALPKDISITFKQID